MAARIESQFMTRKSLKPQLNQIRAWVQQGRTDAWIAHQLEATVQQIETFKAENSLNPDGVATPSAAAVDLRDEDDALVANELEADEARAAEEAAEAARLAAEAASRPLEGTFEHGEEGYGLWFDPAVADNPLYAEHWAGHRPVEVTIEADSIIIRRSGTSN